MMMQKTQMRAFSSQRRAVPVANSRSRTSRAVQVNAEISYVMVKPDGVQRGLVGEIIGRFEKKGFQLRGLKLYQTPNEVAAEHYKDLAAKPFYKDLVSYIVSGPVVCMVWEGKGVVASARKMIGATNPLTSEPGTIRGDFAVEVGRNVIHGSDSPENGERETALWFKDGLVSWTPTINPWLHDLQFQGRRDWPLETTNDDWGLTPPQQETYVEQFRRILAAKNAWREDRHDYYVLRRFLRARTYDLEKATFMWLNNLKFKQEFQVDTILQDFYFGERDKFLVCFPQGYHKTDKMGRPVYIQLLGQVNVDQMKRVTSEERMLKFHIQEYERCAKVILPVCSQLAGRCIDQTFGIMDVRGVGLSHMTGEVKRLLGLITKYDQDNYPEMLGHICIINAPAVFRVLWGVVKNMLDPRTQGKIEILGTNYLGPLLKWVDAEALPDWLGGKSHGSLLDDVGPWSDPETISQLGIDLEQLRAGQKPMGSLLPMASTRRREVSLEAPISGASFRRPSENLSDGFQSPSNSLADLSAYRSALALRNPSSMVEPDELHRTHASNTSTSQRGSHSGDHLGPGGSPIYPASGSQVQVHGALFAAIPEQQSAGGATPARSGTLMQRVSALEALLGPFRPQLQMALAGAENSNGGGPAGVLGGVMMNGAASTRSAPQGSLLYRVEVLEEAMMVLTAAQQASLQTQQQLLAEQKARQQAAAESKCCGCCCIM